MYSGVWRTHLEPRKTRLASFARAAAGCLGLVGVLALLIALAAGAGRQIVGAWQPRCHPVDYGAAVWVCSLDPAWMDAPLGFCSWIGNAGPMAVCTGSIFFYLLYRRRYFSALCAGLAMPGTAIMWKVTSLLVERPRPEYWTLQVPGDLGYPGGHVMNAVVVAGVCLAATLPRLSCRWRKSGILLFWALFVAGTFLCRIYVNAHFLTDQVAGLLMGLLWVLVSIPLCRWAFPNLRDAEPDLLPAAMVNARPAEVELAEAGLAECKM